MKKYYIKKDASEIAKINLAYPSLEAAAQHCPEGFSVFDEKNKCLYTKTISEEEYVEIIESSSMITEHDKYKYLWRELKKNIKSKIDVLQEPVDSTNTIKHFERVVEERELMRVLGMMKSLEDNQSILARE